MEGDKFFRVMMALKSFHPWGIFHYIFVAWLSIKIRFRPAGVSFLNANVSEIFIWTGFRIQGCVLARTWNWTWTIRCPKSHLWKKYTSTSMKRRFLYYKKSKSINFDDFIPMIINARNMMRNGLDIDYWVSSFLHHRRQVPCTKAKGKFMEAK